MGGGAYGQVYAIFNWFYAVGMLGGTRHGSHYSTDRTPLPYHDEHSGPLIGGALVDFVGFHRMLFIFCGVSLKLFEAGDVFLMPLSLVSSPSAASLAFAPVAMLHWWDVKRKESNAAITQVMSGVEPGLR